MNRLNFLKGFVAAFTVIPLFGCKDIFLSKEEKAKNILDKAVRDCRALGLEPTWTYQDSLTGYLDPVRFVPINATVDLNESYCDGKALA